MNMKLKEFKDYIESLPSGKIFDYGLSSPFSWRGSYDEVAFDIIDKPMIREEILVNINMAYTNEFEGYKGGEYRYRDYTEVHFEDGYSSYTDGGHCAELIAKIEGGEIYSSQELRLVTLAFKK